MKKVLLSLVLVSTLGITACSTGEVAAGAVGAGAGYIVGRESKD